MPKTEFSEGKGKTISLNGLINFKYSIVKSENTSSGVIQLAKERLQGMALGRSVPANRQL